MTLPELLAQIYEKRIRLSVSKDDERELLVRGPKAALDSTLLDQLRENKLAIIAALYSRGKEAPARIPVGAKNITPDMLSLAQLSQAEIDSIAIAIPGGSANIQDIYPLAPLQEGVLFHHLMTEEGDPYLLAFQLSFDTRIQLDAYLDAMQAAVNRHDILRTSVHWEDLSAPMQVVSRNITLPVGEITLDATAGDLAEQLYSRFDPRHYRIDVRQAPLLRVYIAEDKQNQRWLMLQHQHHLIGDHSTQEVLQQEIEAHLLGRQDELPAPLPFRNLVAQARLGVSQQEHEVFFRKMLGDIEEPTAPFGLLDVQGDGSGIEQAHLPLNPDMSRRLRANAKRLGVGVASLCHLAWAQVMAKTSGREDVVFGTVLFGRMQGSEGTDRTMGLFINTLPVRISIGEEGAETSVRKTHALLAGLMRHEHASLALAQRCSSVPAPAPLFSALLNYRHSPGVTQAPSEDQIRAFEGVRWLRSEERTNYPLSLSVEDFGLELGLTAQAPASIGPLRVCHFMETALASLVHALEVSPSRSVRTLDVLPLQERQQLLYDWNATQAEFPSDVCIHELFEQQAIKTPEAIAVVFEDRELSYAELNRQSNQLAHYLRGLGIKPDDRVALCVERSLEMIVALLAVLKSGGAYVPLDPDYPVDRLRFMLEDSEPVALLTQGHLRALFPDLQSALPVLTLEDPAPWQDRPHSNPSPAAIGLTPGHLAYVIYTSGSTGTPKGVLVQHRGVAGLFYATNALFKFNSSDNWSLFHSYAFDFSVWEIWGALFHGGRLVIVGKAAVQSPIDFYELLCREKVSVLNQTPSAFRQLSGVQAQSNLSHSLRHVIFGGEPLEALTLKAWHEHKFNKQTQLINMYGITEITVHATYHPLSQDDIENRNGSTIGVPLPSLQIYILDGYGEPVPIGVSGELHIGGAGVARGYLKRPELTAEKFVADPFSTDPQARMYRTGDLGRWLPDGNIEFLGRNDLQVKIRGFRIELGEIEARLMEYKGVRDAVVIAREDIAGDKRLAAYYTLASEASGVDAAALSHHLAVSLPEYMVPSAYVHLEVLPLTPNGKLDRKALPAPDIDAYATVGYEPPQGENEIALAAIWAELLRLDQIGRHDNFFSLGGHSLLAVRVITKIRQALSCDIAINDLFTHPVLSDLAHKIGNAAYSVLPPIVRTDRDAALPLSFAQQRLWFLSQMDGVSAAYHIPFGLRLLGHLDHLSLHRALDRILLRHEALRTVFRLIDGEPTQQVASIEGSPFLLRQDDLRKEAGREQKLERLMAEEAAAPFDLEYGPLTRGRLIALGDEDHVLLLTMHHIVSDGWSMGVLLNELSTLYAAFRRGQPDPLPDLEIQYADYAVWQRKWVEGEILQEQASYWKKTLANAPALLELPTDRPRPTQQSYAGAFAGLALDQALTTGLKNLSRRHGTTLFMTLLSAWAVLVSRISGQRDVVIGTPTANRGRAEIEGLIGFFVNTLAIRIDLSSSPTVSEVLAQVKAQTIAAQQHQDIPFEQVVEILQPIRSLAHSPLFQIMFNWENASEDKLILPGLELGGLPPSSHNVAKFDVTLTLHEVESQIVGRLEYATSLFESTTIERYLGHFRVLLKAMVADDRQAVDRLPLLNAAERQQLLYDWNATQAEFPSDVCIHELFEQQAIKTPEAIAVVFEDRELSYAELNRQSNQLAHYLRGLGIKPDDRVALCVERSLEMIVALLAVLKSGGAYVPLDPDYPVDRLRFMLEDSEPVALLTQGHLRALFPDLQSALPVLTLEDPAPWWDRPHSNPSPAAIGLTPGHLAYVIYTSGSSGTPKGVLVQHRGLVNRLVWMQYAYDLAPTDAVLQKTPFSFDVSVWELFLPLVVGAKLVMADPHGHTDTTYIAETIRRYSITTIHFVPSMLQAFLDALDDGGDCSTLLRVVCSGEALPALLARRLRDKLWHISLHNLYGPTEATIDVTAWLYQEDAVRTSIPIGRPISNTQIYILDGCGQPVPIGVSGELHIGGAGVARGYLKRPELTAEKFVADPFSTDPQARMYRTGDLGRWLPDGNIEFLGRNDLQVKIRGFRIELGEIEARLMEYKGIRDAVVIAREDIAGDKRLAAYYTLASEASGVDAAALSHHLAVSLPEYMVPSAYVHLEVLPLTPNGKLDRKALPAPDIDAYATVGYEPPQGENEIALAAIWAELLRLDQIGRHDNFFSLGGHSLLAITLIERMRRVGMQVDVRAIFTTPTLASLAMVAGGDTDIVQIPENRIPVGAKNITPDMLSLAQLSQAEIDSIAIAIPGGSANIQDIYPLAPLQEGVLFHHLMTEEGDPYLQAFQLSFDTRIQLDAYLDAMQTVVNRHDILRTSVHWEDLSAPMQVVSRNITLPVGEITLDATAGDLAEQLYSRFDPRHYRIDVRQAPLLRVYIAEDKQNQRWLMLQHQHHLIDDNTSLRKLQQEIEAHLLGRQDELPAPLPFRNLVAQARLGVSQQEHEVFFRKMLGDIEEPTAPFGLLDVQGDGSGIEQAHLPLNPDMSRRLRANAKRLGVGVASLCHLAWAQVMAKTSGREDVVFGTVLFGRMQGSEGTDRTMGLFINTLPVRISIGEEGAETSVRKTHALLAGLMRHEHASLALAQRCSSVPAPAPLFSALLNYRHSPGVTQAPSEDQIRAFEGVRWLRSEERTNYPLSLSVEDFGLELGLTAQAPASIGPLRVCHFMETALASLVHALEVSPSRSVRTLDVLPLQERQQLLYDWNATQAEFPSDVCIHELFEQQAIKTPEAIAVVFEDRELSYAELNRQSNQLAHYLRGLGIKPDDRVALCVERSLEMIVALLAVLKSGGAYVPLDPDYPVDRLRFMLEDSEPVALLTQGHLRALFPDLQSALPVLTLEDPAPWWDRPHSNPSPAAIGLTPGHLAYVIYTSGSTGTPKGVLVQHNNVVGRLCGIHESFAFTESDVIPNVSSASFDISLLEILLPLVKGGTCHLITAQDIRNMDRLIKQTRTATVFNAVTSLMDAWQKSVPLEECRQFYPGLHTLLVGGEAVPQQLLERLSLHFPNAKIIETYGPTETTLYCTSYTATCGAPGLSASSIGAPLNNTQIYILDGCGEPVPIGVSGELHIGGAGVARGYLKRPELTAEKFVADPFSTDPQARMYRTGDLGRWLPDGNIEFLGRNDLQVKIRGFRIELGEIEARLMEYKGVRDAVVIAREDIAGDKRLAAYYTLASEASGVDAAALSHHLAVSLPEYMVPSAYVHLEVLPLTPNGKLDRKALPAPDIDAYATVGYEPPQGENEIALAAIWAELLRLDQIGRHDNFFSLGGHSLLAVRVITKIRQALSCDIAINDLFTHPVLSDLAHKIGNAAYSVLPPIVRTDRDAALPLSFAQQRLWFLSQMDGVSAAYHIPFGLRLLGHLDHLSLHRALDRILLRHEALRTVFRLIDGEPTQQVASIEGSPFLLRQDDLRKEAGREQKLERLMAEEAAAPFDLEYGPLTRGRLIALGDEDHVLLLTMHHIVSDGWSMGVLLNELSTLYAAFRRGQPDPLPDLEIQYADYAVWQRKWVEGEILQEQASYWKKTLANAPALLELPTDRPRPTQQSYAGAFAGLALDQALTTGLKNLSRRHGTTLFMTLLSAWAVLVSRISGQRDVVIGTPTANRGRAEIEGLIGFFVNTLAIRIDLSSSPTVSEVLAQVKAQTIAAQQHQDIPFEQVVEILQPIRSLAHSPLFQIMFNWENASEDKLILPGLELGGLPPSSHNVAKFDLTLALREAEEGVYGGLEYATSLFESTTIERYLGHFRVLLEAMVADDRQAVDRLPLLNAAERQQLLYDWNATQAEFPSDVCIHELFEQQAIKTPEAIAVVFEDRELSYAELNRQSNQLAHYLRGLGIKPDDRVALCVERSLEMIVALLAVLKSGGAYVPLDPDYPVDRLRFMLEDSEPVALLTQGRLRALFPDLQSALPVLTLEDPAPWRDRPHSNPSPAAIGLTPGHLAYVIYTSGSTGTPKGVLVQHRGVVNYLHWMIDIYAPIGGSIVSSSLSFDATVTSLLGPLLCGGDIHLLREQDVLDKLLLYLRSNGGQKLLKISPSHLNALGHNTLSSRTQLSAKVFVVGGEQLLQWTVRLWREINSDIKIVNEYGPTETVVGSIAYELSNSLDSLTSIPIGRPISNTQIYILDGCGEPVPIGVSGELHIGGAGVARGYLKRPELTAEKFVADPFSTDPQARMYRTGDLGRWLPDGNIEFLGRNDLQVKIRGFRIELGEIEARLMEYKGVRDAVVIAREDIAGDKRLAAYYTLASEASGVDAAALSHHLAVSLPEYMVPSAYVHLEVLPLTPNGKLDRKALPAPDIDAYATVGYEPPQGENEIALAAIWAELLRLDQIGRHDNFFSLGGHSLLAVRVITKIRQALSCDIAINDLFTHPVLSDLAHKIGNAAYSVLPPIVRTDRDAALPLSFAQQRLWFLSQMDGVSAAYHIPFGLRLLGHLDHLSLHRALDRILLRHEALRTVFRLIDGEPTQQVASIEGNPFLLRQDDLRKEAGREQKLERLMAEEAAAPFDLEYGPLTRGRLIALGDEDHVLLLTMHHIVSDGWSMGVLLNELSTLYAAFRRGQPDPLPDLEIQYADYAVWQRKWVEGEILQEQASYWKKTLANAPALLELPTDRPRPTQQSYAGAFAGLALDQALTTGLKNLSRRHGTTLFMTLLSAWAVLVSRISGQRDVVIGTPTANRGRAEIEGLIGFFVNTLAIRIDLSSSPTVSEVLAQVKAQTIAAQQHQDIPFEQVVEILQPIRSLAHSPLFQIMFNWENASEDKLILPGLELGGLPPSSHNVAKFDLTLALREAEEGVYGGLEYATSLFESTTIERYLGHFRVLLEAMVADDRQAVDRLPLLNAAERQQLLYDWNATQAEFPSDVCIHELFEQQAIKTPEAIAVVFEDRELSYAELNRQSNQLAHYLRGLGIKPDDRVALCVERSLEMIVALLAVLKSGGAYVPLDPDYPVDRLRFMLEDSEPVALLTQGHLRALFPDLQSALPVLTLEDPAPWWDRPHSNPSPAAIGLTPGHLAYVIYTSGSTGTPKGVLVQHRGLVNRLVWMQYAYDLAPTDAVLQKTPFSFDVSVWELFLPLVVGAKLVMADPHGHTDTTYIAETIRRYSITTIHFVPSMLQAFLDALDDGGDCSTLLRVVCSGEALPALLARRLRDKLWHISLHNLYGPTEATIDVTAWLYQEDAVRTSIPIGRPISNTQIYILDGYGEPVPIGVSGELHIGGAGVARGYLKRPELTAEKFVADPFSTDPQARMYRTGDLGRWLPDGNIEFLGRNDLQVKIRGFRIELGEIEARLMEYKGVRDAVVIAREDIAGDKRLAAYYTLASEASGVDAAALSHHLAVSLPEYMVPSAYVHLEVLPLTPNGKLDRKALPAPDIDAYATVGYEPPQGENEIALAAIWAELLRLDQIGRHDNFFSLGGHSLLAITLIERMRRVGMQVDVRAIFTTPTLASLAMVAGGDTDIVQIPENRIPVGAKNITPDMLSLAQLSQAEIDSIAIAIPGGSANIQDIYPLAPLQEGVLFHHLMTEEGDPYLLAFQLSFDTRIQLDAYLDAMQAAVNRHDILRTSVHWEDLSAPMQVVSRNITLPVGEITLDATAGDLAEQLYSRFDPRHYRIDVRQAPLLRVYIAEDKQNQRWLMLQHQHHLIGDHSTQEVLQQEIEAHLLGRQDELPAPLPFRNLVAQARLGVSQQEHEVFFRKMLGDIEEPTAPFGLLDVQGDGSGIEQAHLPLNPDMSRRLRANAKRLGVGVASLCHLAWAQVMAKTSGREDVVFGTVLFGRMQGSEGTDRTMGLFINTLPVRISIGEEGAETSVRKTHALLAGLMRHEHASLALAQRCSSVPAPAPLFSALLNYRHSPGVTQAPSEDQIRAFEGVRWLRSEERTNYPLSLSVEDFGLELGLTAQAPASIGPLRVCHFMETALASLVHALEVSPSRSVRTLDVLPLQERQQLLYDWNATQAEFPSDVCIHELFEQQAIKTPEAIAVVFEDRELSYAELNRQSNQLAHYLRGLGIKPDDRVALCVERSLEMIVALLAVLKSGGAYVPLDPDYPVDRLRFMLEDSEPVALLTQGHLRALFPDLQSALPVLTLEDPAPWWDRPHSNPSPAAIGLTPGHLAYVIYTSGSTGTPKGVLVQHRGVVNHIFWQSKMFGFSSSDTVLQRTSISFDASVWELWTPLYMGGTLCLLPVMDDNDPARITAIMKHHRVTIAQFVPSLLRTMLQQMKADRCGLRHIFCGGEPLSTDILMNAREFVLGDLINLYGPTETTIDATSWIFSNASGPALSPIGRPISNTQIYILDGCGQPVPIGVSGELHIGGAGVARGYLKRPELTAEKFVADPFSTDPQARMYRTGDLGRWLPDGNIEFLGRNDLQVKIRGFRIELGEIEARLMEYKGIRDAVVIAREDIAGDKRLAAYYTLASEASGVDAAALSHHLAVSLPEYMVPSAYVHLEVLPLTPNGKLDRKALPAPDIDAYATVGYEPPQGENEIALAAIWAELLRLDQIGRHDNFFSLGGHSLLAITLIERMRRIGMQVDVRAIFTTPTLASLASNKQDDVIRIKVPVNMIPYRYHQDTSLDQKVKIYI